MHGTQVSYLPVLLRDPNLPRKTSQEAAMNVRPVEEHPQRGLECGVETRLGSRPTNEDRLVASDLYDLGFLAGVFDGHGGIRCVDYVSQRFSVVLHALYTSMVSRLKHGLASLTATEEEALIGRAVCEAYTSTDAEFMNLARKEGLRDGSTGLTVLISHGFQASPEVRASVLGCRPGAVAKLFCANCGDCRAILLRGNRAVRLSEDHKPERHDEANRIQLAGGVVVQSACGTHRVGRRSGNCRMYLSTSRSFGDAELKEPQPLVIAEPELLVLTLEPEDWAVVLASDGVWNSLSDQAVFDAVFQVMGIDKLGPVEAAQEVANRAQQKGSTDNVTVLLMRLGWAEPPAQKPKATE